MNRFVMMGVQGCGKGTQAALLEQDLGLVHISVGDIFRWHIQHGTELGAQVLRTVNAGQLVSDEVVDQVVKARLAELDTEKGFVLDGFPRDHAQAEFLLNSYDIDAAIIIQVPDDIVMQRVLARRLCSSCGLDYNLFYHRPKTPGVCDVCGGALLAREDDTDVAVRERLAEYHARTEPVIALFKQRGRVIVADGTASPEEVQRDIRRQLERQA